MLTVFLLAWALAILQWVHRRRQSRREGERMRARRWRAQVRRWDEYRRTGGRRR